MIYIIKKCPLCQGILTIGEDVSDILSYTCFNTGCIEYDVSKFKIYYHKSELIAKYFVLDNYYIRIDYRAKTTEISKLITCVYMDTIHIDRIIEVDFKEPQKYLDKIRTLTVFS